MKKIGLLGGSFDPPHRGHLYISNQAKKILLLDEVWWLVTPQNPLKISKPATYEERVKNCLLITKGHGILIKEIEKEINSKYTHQTLKYILNHYTNIKFFWLMGADNLINFHRWEKWRLIMNNISIVIFKRYGYNNKALRSIASKTFANKELKLSKFDDVEFSKTPSWAWVNNSEVKISSTEIRQQRKLLRG